MSSQRFTQVDAFTDQPFAGNPAAVCLLSSPRNSSWMQQVAQEMNLAETAFLVPRSDGFDLRWFTPALEVDLCGHATLASAHVLWEEGHLAGTAVAQFHTRSGILTAFQKSGMIWLDFPVTPSAPSEAPADLRTGIGAKMLYVGRTTFDFLVELESESQVRSVQPDLGALTRLKSRGVIVTARSDNPAFDFVSRFFAPGAGVSEDPVTGSAHCALGPFWSDRLNKTDLTGYQASARGGTVRVRLVDSRAHLGGRAITIARGELLH
jgi:PhzF family phenazine biosynthesis protein